MVATVTSSEYLLPSMGFEPAYAKLYGTGELQQRVEQAMVNQFISYLPSLAD